MPSNHLPTGQPLTQADLDTLGQRNLALAARKHKPSRRQRIRRVLLKALAKLPVRPLAKPISNRVLLVRPDHIGDMLLTMPAIQALKEAEPSLVLIGLVGNWAAEIMAAYPEVDQVLTLPFPGFNRGRQRQPAWLRPLAPYRDLWRWARMIRQLRPQTAVILRPDHWWGAALAWLAGVPQRVGFANADAMPFLTEAVQDTPAHSVAQNMALINCLLDSAPSTPRLSFPTSRAHQAELDSVLAERRLDLEGQAPIIIHAGGGHPIRGWAASQWAAVADALAEMWGLPVLFTGSYAERQEAAKIRAQMKYYSVNLAGDTNLGQLAALFTRAKIVLGPDTGPLHLAVAVGTPSVHLFGPADPAQFAPYGNPARHILLTSQMACQPCRILDWGGDAPANHPCVRQILPEAVIAAALKACGEAR
jgi:heptosyltransferase III